jgi:hypothetical protein
MRSIGIRLSLVIYVYRWETMQIQHSLIYDFIQSDTFRRVRKILKSDYYLRPTDHPRGTNRLPLGGFS